jgi:hypothetical protein
MSKYAEKFPTNPNLRQKDLTFRTHIVRVTYKEKKEDFKRYQRTHILKRPD